MDSMKRQNHGGDIYRNKGVLDFSVNSNPSGVPETVLRAVRSGAADIVHYPDPYCERLTQAVSRFEGVSGDELIFGNGAAELFFAAVQAVKPKKALVALPAFSEYERALRAADAGIIYHVFSEDTGFEADESLLEQMEPGLDMVFLCSPGNPSGCVIPKDILYAVLEKCRECGSVLVLDECFTGFLKEADACGMKEARKEYKGLLIVKAFTKLFAMPGLRLGYAISSDQGLLRKMREVLQPWNVSSLAQSAGEAALTDCRGYCVEEYIQHTRKLVSEGRRYLSDALEERGFRVYNSKANYIFFKGKPGLYEKALNAGFLIRDCGGYRGLSPGYYRIAVRKKEENERFVAWLRGL